jgi:hypothetical protein
LGIVVLEPEAPALYTFDRAHLTPQSSREWTGEFLKELEPTLEKCIASPHDALQTHNESF